MPYRQADVSEKPVIYREAIASGRIRLKKGTITLIRKGELAKGDPISLAAMTAITAAKKTPEVVALCHPLRIEMIEPKVKVGDGWVEVTVRVAAHEKTGVEMEALTAVSVALLNIWDVTKAYEKDSRGQYPSTLIESIKVISKVKGGK
ncbi:MAG: cyclic pyranopterin monophosphate synthase MoaC [Nitrososphaerota archaeon]|nr:cyclic pyranopterin monophosphate synthase MoaC [Nitrososphaerota archaeon]MDG6968502.1 cyclic pyranopterin monophosphate synthase MoaC [Nitrososphaerota archaeon]MDG6973370.1 cyclic pyranopterin monophosphate synthase MoaC [Nitrososphaerota archaeon]MDG6975434.1 cyclic pyranopterin monophosphate synthase MoaC [Nitrososphaerota archaeon]MDG7027167.1 cyclic pyranopterin monophosphate synthase MoaC [Nitrososphaerota archaeon]